MVSRAPTRSLPWLLPALMLAGAAAGLTIGASLGERWQDPALLPLVLTLRACGTVFLAFLKALVVPLIATSVMLGVAQLAGLAGFGRRALGVAFYYFSTTLVAVATGLVLVNVIAPGKGVGELTARVAPAAALEARGPAQAIYELVVSLFPPNWIAAAAEGNLLGLIVVAVLLGATIASLPRAAERLVPLIQALNEVLLRLVRAAVWAAPLGILGLVADRIGVAGGGDVIGRELAALGAYALTVILGLAVHGAITLPLVLRFVAKRAPLRYASGMSESLVTAFGTASSAATLGVTMQGVVDRNGVSPLAAELVVPLGTTVNMNGTALYEAVAAVFIAQVIGIELSGVQQIVVLLTATLAAVGAAAIPEAGLVTLVLVLSAVGLPAESVGLILSIDWILDRFRTAVNVWGDAVGAAVIDRWLFPGGDAP